MSKYIQTLNGLGISVCLCENCIKALQEYNPYVDYQGKQIPISNIVIKSVGQNNCENTRIVKQFKEVEE